VCHPMLLYISKKNDKSGSVSMYYKLTINIIIDSNYIHMLPQNVGEIFPGYWISLYVSRWFS
jgi:hypothetical protein